MEYLGRNTERFKTVQVLNDLTVEKVLFVSNINDTRPTAGQVLTWDGRVITWKDDTNTTYLPATSSVLGLLKIEDDTEQSVAANAVSATAARTYGIQFNSSDQAVVNVPWTDTTYTLPQATATARGGVELFSNTVQSVAGTAVSTTASRTYGVQLNGDDQMVVNVPWVDTDTKVTLNGTTVNGVATFASTDTLDIESTLTYASNILTIGPLTTTSVGIQTPTKSSGQGGDRMNLICGNSGAGTDINAGQVQFWSGLGTGNKPGGHYNFFGAPAANPGGGAGVSRESYLFRVYTEVGGGATSSFTRLYDCNNDRNHFTTEVKANGQTNLTTQDFASHNADLAITADGAVDIITTDASNDITLNSAGEIELNADGGNINFKDDTAQLALISTTGLDFTDNLNAGIQFEGSTDDAHKTRINVIDPTVTRDINFPNASGTVALTTDTLGGQYWHQMVPGYRQNNTSTTNYYTFYRNWYENWSNSDSDPTSISSTDSYSSFMIAPRAGQITNIKIQGTSNDVGYNDPFKFYMYKGALSNNSGSLSLTLIATTSAITPPASANKTWSHTQDFTGATFSEDDNLYIWLKKDSNTGNQDLFFNININGLYTN